MNTNVFSYLGDLGLNQVVEYFTTLLGFDATFLVAGAVFTAVALAFIGLAATVGGFGTYAERKISADLQARIGPNRVGPYGLLQVLADGVKMILKEDIVPRDADKLLFYLAPTLCVVGIFSTLVVFPFSSGLTLSHLNVGVLYLVGISSLVGLGVFLGGYASNSKWSMLGGMRGASQIISYEIPVTICILCVCLMAGGMSFEKIVGGQGAHPWQWNLLHNPFMFISFFVFFVGMLAEANRAPFDLPEAESELVSGFHTEYTGMRFGFFALAEYVEVFVLCGVCSSLYLGGYNVPFGIGGNGPIGQLLQLGTLLGKTFALYYIVIWIRWTFPRLRVDHLMSVCWKFLTPIAMFCLIGCSIWMVCFKDESIWSLLGHLIESLTSGSGGH